MIRNSEYYKKELKKAIRKISQNKEQYVIEPEKNFTRKRKLPLDVTLRAMMSLGGSSLNREMLDIFNFDTDMPSSQAFLKRRSKILTKAYEDIFYSFTQTCSSPKLFKGYRLLAVDGSDLHVPTNPHEEDSFFPERKNLKAYNLLHLNAMYDLNEHIYTDAVIQSARKHDECAAFTAMVDRYHSSHPAVFIADRGFEAYNNLAHVQEAGQRFLIRVRDITSHGSISQRFHLPEIDEFDISFNVGLTKKKTNETKKSDLIILSNIIKFDYLPPKCQKNVEIEPYNLFLRFVRVKVTDDLHELLLTNLPVSEFSPEDLKELYAMRWGIETSFRDLKYTVGLIYFHSKKTEYIIQEIWTHLTMYNFSEMIISHIIISKRRKKRVVKVIFSSAVHICYQFFLNKISPSEVDSLISRYVSNVRSHKPAKRVISKKTYISFFYRIA